jgi:hypothetical protein
MKKNRFYIILSILTIIFFFSVAALCNQCGTTAEDKVDVDEEDMEILEEEVTEEEADVEEAIEEDDSEASEEDGEDDGEESDEEEEEEAEEDAEAPTITLEIYEGPLPADDLCYYRIQANVTGSPNPTIEFSKDDSGGSWGSKKVQINLSDPADTYTLTATATNSEGIATATINLSWGCDEPEPEITTGDMDITASTAGSGYIAQGFGATMGTDEVFIGDTNADTITKGYLSFDIGDLSDMDGITFTDVDLRIPIDEVGREPWLAADTVDIKVFYYGSNLDVPEDFAVGGERVKTFDITDSLDNLSFGNDLLMGELQDAVESGKSSFQFKLGFNNKSNNGIGDWFLLQPSSITLSVEYEIPG